jgi:hypothetical protein
MMYARARKHYDRLKSKNKKSKERCISPNDKMKKMLSSTAAHFSILVFSSPYKPNKVVQRDSLVGGNICRKLMKEIIAQESAGSLDM